MNPLLHSIFSKAVAAAILSQLALAAALAQATKSGTIEGSVADLQHHPIAEANIRTISSDKHETSTNSGTDGRFRIELSPGSYSVTVSLAGWRESSREVSLTPGQTLSLQFLLEKAGPSTDRGTATSLGEFADAPNYTVSGITDPTNLGGHGSDTIVRTKESLAKATASLGNSDISAEKQRVAELRNGPDTAELHALLADIAEREGRPLDAVNEYQKAVAMAPTEANLFSLGAELLLHGASEPAAETFAHGTGKYPNSTRLALGHAAALYSLGKNSEAAKLFAAACDINPAEPEPYLFLGRLQTVEKSEPPGWTERLARFASAHPNDAIAQHNYAVALTKGSDAAERASSIESLLRKSIELDPKFGDAYLQLGVFYASRGDFAKAIPEYRNAIANTQLPDEAHFRLAEAYRRTGQPDKAKEEIQLYSQISKQRTQETQQERNKIPQFVYTLRGSKTSQ